MLKIQFKDKRSDPFWVMEKIFTIGQASDNSLVIVDDSVSEQHAKLVSQGETFTLRDLGSQMGTYVNGSRINEKKVVCGDTIAIGKVELEIVDPSRETQTDHDNQSYWSLIADSSWLSGQEFPIVVPTGGSVIIGRGRIELCP